MFVSSAVFGERAVGQRVLESDGRRELLVVDDDRLHRVACRDAGLGNHDRHGIAHVTHLVDRNRPVLRDLDVVGDRPHARHRVGPFVAQVRAAERSDDTLHRARALHVDAGDAGVRVRAAHEPHPERAGNHDVVDEAGLTGEQRGVFPAAHRRAHDRARGRDLGGGHNVTRCPLAASTALTMLW